MIDWLAAAGLGLVLGAVTGMPIGVVNAAIVDAAVANRLRFALGVGCGGALADAIHAGVAFAGVGQLDPAWTRAVSFAAAAALCAYAIVAWRARAAPVAAEDHSSFARGAPTGFLLTLPNPAAFGAWLTVAAALWRQPHPLVVGAGVGLGSAAWFALLARFVAVRRDHRIARALPRIAVGVLVAIAITTAARAGCS